MLEKKERQKLGIADKEDEHFQNVKIRFTVIPEKKFPDGASPSDITKYSMDNSFVLESLLSSFSNSNGMHLLILPVSSPEYPCSPLIWVYLMSRNMSYWHMCNNSHVITYVLDYDCK